MSGIKSASSGSRDLFQDLNHKNLYEKGQKWFKLYPSIIDKIVLHDRAYPRSYGMDRSHVLYVVLFWLVDNEFTRTYADATRYRNLSKFKLPYKIPEGGIGALPWEKRQKTLEYLASPVDQKKKKKKYAPDFLGPDKPLCREHEEIRTLLSACSRASTGHGAWWEPLFEQNFPTKIYKLEARPAGDTYRQEWKFHPVFPGEEMPDIIDQEGQSLVLYDGSGDVPLGASKETGEAKKSLRQSTIRINEMRKIAKAFWDKDQTITIADMIFKDEITSIFRDRLPTEKYLRRLIRDLCPNRSPGRRTKQK